MKIDAAYLERLIVEQIELMESNQSAQGFLASLLEIGYRAEIMFRPLSQSPPRRGAYSRFSKMSPERKSEIFENFVNEKLNPFSGKYIFIKTDHGRGGGGTYKIPFNFAFGQIDSFVLREPFGNQGGNRTYKPNKVVEIKLDNSVNNSRLAYPTQNASLVFDPSLTRKFPPTVQLSIDDFYFLGEFNLSRNIQIYDHTNRFGGFNGGNLDDGVEIRISDSSNVFSVAQDMGVPIPSSDNEAIEMIREAIYDEEEIDIFYKRIFRNSNFYSSVVDDYLQNLENQLRDANNEN